MVTIITMGRQLGIYHIQIWPSEHITVLSGQCIDITGYQDSRCGFQEANCKLDMVKKHTGIVKQCSGFF